MDSTQTRQESTLIEKMTEGPNKAIDSMITPCADDISKGIVGARECFRLALYGLRCARDKFSDMGGYFSNQWKEMMKFKKDYWDNPDISILKKYCKQ